MLSLSNLKTQQAETYYQSDDYYTDEEYDATGFKPQWFGEGATQLGLTGDVSGSDFRELLQGYAPDGQALFQRKVDVAKRRAGTDYTFSAPKSVSIAALVQQDSRVLAAHHEAVRAALAVLESRYVESRITIAPGDRRRVFTGNIISALFPHQTSRELDPQLHTHCVTINATQSPDGRWFSFSNENVIRNQKLLGQIYQNELAYRLRQCGYEVESRAEGQFELSGYDADLLTSFSTRRQQIQAVMEQWAAEREAIADGSGRPVSDTAARREAANLRSRRRKCRDIEREDLTRAWQQHVQSEGYALPDLPRAPDVLPAQVTVSAMLDTGIAHCQERRTVFPRESIERFVLEHHLGQQSFEQLTDGLNQSAALIKVEPSRGAASPYTTQAAVQLELATIRAMQQGQRQVMALAQPLQVQAAIADMGLTAGQQAAVELSATSWDQIVAWQGVAGAGKTHALAVVKIMAEQAGYEVKGYAPSAEAASVLSASLQIEATTVAHLLQTDNAPRRHALWIVDEASLLSMKAAHELLQKAHEQNARMILVGDTRQLSAVEAGNPFKSLQAAGMATAYLEESLRQKTRSLQQAVRHLASQQTDAGIDELLTSGSVQIMPNPDTSEQQVTDVYRRLSEDERSQTLILTSTRATRHQLTERLRSGLQADGSLGANQVTVQGFASKDLTQAEAGYAGHYALGDILVPLYGYRRKGIQADPSGQGLQPNQQYEVVALAAERNELTVRHTNGQTISLTPRDCPKKLVFQPEELKLAVGDRLRWTRNDKRSGRRNGQAFTIAALQDDRATIINDQGQQTQIDLTDPLYLDYAWASTIHSAQGKTADRVLVLADGNLDREAFYVACSRAKHHLNIYTDNLDRLRQQAHRSRSQENVTDYLSELRTQCAASIGAGSPVTATKERVPVQADQQSTESVPPALNPTIDPAIRTEAEELRRRWYAYRDRLPTDLTGEALDRAIAAQVLKATGSLNDAAQVVVCGGNIEAYARAQRPAYAERVTTAAKRDVQIQGVCDVLKAACQIAGVDEIDGRHYIVRWHRDEDEIQLWAKGDRQEPRLVLHQLQSSTCYDALELEDFQAIERVRQQVLQVLQHRSQTNRGLDLG